MLKIKAKVYFKTKDEDGFYKDPISGIQPSLSVEGDLIMCVVTGSKADEILVRGRDHLVSIELPYGEMFADEIVEGYIFHLNVGGKVIANGEVISIIAPC